MDLKDIRNEIDKLDSVIIDTLVKRLSFVDQIADIKYAKGLEIRDQKREEELIKNRFEKLKKAGINDPEFAQMLFGAIIKKSRDLQTKRIIDLEKIKDVE